MPLNEDDMPVGEGRAGYISGLRRQITEAKESARRWHITAEKHVTKISELLDDRRSDDECFDILFRILTTPQLRGLRSEASTVFDRLVEARERLKADEAVHRQDRP